MNVNTAIMLGVFVILGILSLVTHGFQGVLEGLKGGVDTLRNVWPLMLLALGIAGFLQVVIPRDLISGALGPSSGLKGYFIGWGVGAVMPGAPYAILPVAGSLLKAGGGYWSDHGNGLIGGDRRGSHENSSGGRFCRLEVLRVAHSGVHPRSVGLWGIRQLPCSMVRVLSALCS